MRFFLGLDAGGSRTRAVVLLGDGRVVGRGEAGGGNPAGADPAVAIGNLTRAAGLALHGLDRGRVAGCLVGLAGYRSLADPEAYAGQCRAAFGLDCPVRLVPDAVPALASGAPGAPGGTGATGTTGTVLIAGTGAVCVRCVEGRTVASTGGLGWLLGDEGSGFWLGREALRHAHAEPGGRLGRAVLDHCGAKSAAELVGWAYAGPPRRLAELSPLVGGAARDGDAAALAIARTAAGHLTALVRATAVAHELLVLSGSVATRPGPVRDHLLELLADLDPRFPVTDAATAAASLARGGFRGTDGP
ncbi:N-acetylglucosamine kinase [Streptomyces kaniharaensis]|uniref:N-acetylglucosamine kinase n=1 Tax=Streptomyces kaniharaensis TaxID=212423 RepID=UPI0018A81F2D|nr:BadF/BadG/BcrA/BcrD ATPase family protein [Streptomyces kaniharaensis]